MSSELKQMYEVGLLDASAYVLLIVKTYGTAGWKSTFKVKDFCKEWGISKSTFYSAVSKLNTLGLLHWETEESITVWHGADIAKDGFTGETEISTDENEVSLVETEMVKKLPEDEVYNASYSSQTNSNIPDRTDSEKPEIKRRHTMPTENNPPSIEQLTQLEEAKASGAIKDYFFSSDGVCKVVMRNGYDQMPWWGFLGGQT